MPEENTQQQHFVDIRDFTPSGVRDKPSIDINLLLSREYDPTQARVREPDAQFRWIHIPVNDTSLVEYCVRTLVGPGQAQSLPNTWLHKLRPTSSIPRGIVPDHARFMEPSFQIHTAAEAVQRENPTPQPSFALYLPYLNWEVFENINSQPTINTAINIANNIITNIATTKNASRHPRRTLDQFFYTVLVNTRSRDAGQTVSKWTGRDAGKNGREEAKDDSYVVMVDQLWVWALDSTTLVSCFPSPDTRFLGIAAGGTHYTDVMTSVRSEASNCQDLFDLTALLVMHTVTNVFTEENGQFADLIGIYRWAIANKTARHTTQLENFGERQSDRDAEQIAFEGVEELNLTLEVADILDELNMLLRLLDNQFDVLTSLQGQLYHFKPMAPSTVGEEANYVRIENSSVNIIRVSNSGDTPNRLVLDDVTVDTLHISNEGNSQGVRAIGGNAGIQVQRAEQRLRVKKANLEGLRMDAERTHKMLLELLDLEQKAASLAEARETTKQGKAVMLFTIVTIIFLPLSFFTSYFGQNVSEITGDDKNPTSSELWRVAGPISVVVILFALLVAYFIMFPRKQSSKKYIEV